MPVATALGRTQLLGRRAELAELDRVIDDARAGGGSVLVLRGEPGVGKSALMDYVERRATGFRAARAAGVESEAELMLAGVQQLLGPSILGRSERLPVPQRDALARAFGVMEGPPPDRFLVGLAVLGLLSDAAEERPLLCLVDDVQWLDEASRQVLSFIARRLEAERIAMLFAVRQPSTQSELEGLPELRVRGLADHDARELLALVVPGGLDEQVRDQIIAETRGNPLALLELPRGLTPAELAGGFGLPDARTLAGRIEERFVRRIVSLPPETQQVLFVAAAEPVGDVNLLLRATDELGIIGGEAIVPAETAGLIELGARVRFRHPLVRSAAYRAAAPDPRRRAQAALANATDPRTDPDRRAWHRAHATAVPDESIAAELERSASRAQARGGAAAAAAFLERSVELTPHPLRRGTRALAAAQAKFDAGALEAADALLSAATMCPLSEMDRALLDRLRARIAFSRTRGRETPALLSAAARRLEPLDPELARETHLEALWASAVCNGRFAKTGEIVDAAEAATISAGGDRDRAIDLLLHALVTRLAHGYARSVPLVTRALKTFRVEGFSRENLAWCWLACQLAMDSCDDQTCFMIADELARASRERGTLTVLPFALNCCASHDLFAGKFDVAEQLLEEADTITNATRSAPLVDFSVLLAAWRGDRDTAGRLRTAAVADAATRGEFAVEVAEWAAATLHVGLGEYAEAAAAAQRAYDPDGLGLDIWLLPELIEAAVRSGDVPTATAALQRLEERTAVSDTPLACGLQARSRALLNDGAEAEELYLDAIEQLGHTEVLVHHARAQLIYGEWLRRADRRVDARAPLKAAHSAFERMGAKAFAERARRELLATGETVRRHSVEALDELTPQEAQIARMAAEGRTNVEIGAQLYLSSRTVEWHLRKVFTKLGVSSRRELAQAARGRR
jgi:DNA-binding CsgD family transcriptional regulator